MTKRKKVSLILALGTSLLLILLAYGLFIRPWMLNWGATAAETRMALPGDELVPVPGYQSTRAMTIAAPAEEVWAWLIQLGQDRGGFYSYSWLENLFFADIHNTNDVRPEWQNVAVGDLIAMTPRGWPLGLVRRPARSIGVRIEKVKRPELLILRSWGSFVLRPVHEKAARLVIRSRGSPRSFLARILLSLLFDPIHFVMERQMMRGIRLRAEGSVEAASFGESVATAGFLFAALASLLSVFSRRRGRLWAVLPLLYGLAIIVSTSDLKAALVGYTGSSVLIAGSMAFGRLKWAYFLGILIYIPVVLFAARDAYVVFGLVFLVVIPCLCYPVLYRKLAGFFGDVPSAGNGPLKRP